MIRREDAKHRQEKFAVTHLGVEQKTPVTAIHTNRLDCTHNADGPGAPHRAALVIELLYVETRVREPPAVFDFSWQAGQPSFPADWFEQMARCEAAGILTRQPQTHHQPPAALEHPRGLVQGAFLIGHV